MEAVATAIGSFIALAALAWTVVDAWRTERRVTRAADEEKLRRDDVLAWALHVIDVLQSVALACRLSVRAHPPAGLDEKLRSLTFQSSVLIEQGRLFFRNIEWAEFGVDKPEAYRGLRPKILDQLVICHMIACEWPSSDENIRRRMAVLVEDAERCFVSIIRHEVGRDRTASTGASERGLGINLPMLLSNVSEQEIGARGLFAQHN